MIRLVGDVAAYRGGATEKRRVLMDGLAKLVEARRWFWSLSPAPVGGVWPPRAAIDHGGFEDGQFPKLLKAADHPDGPDILQILSQEIRQTGGHHTRTRRQLDPGSRSSRGKARDPWHAAEVGDFLVSVRATPAGAYSVVSLYREPDLADFDGREARIAHIVLAEVPWLHDTGGPEDGMKLLPKLSPRRRGVLNLVLEGHPRKEMAALLGISTHTLDGYVKDIFRHFHVHSQAELIARFRSGSPDDTPGSGD